MWLYFALTSHCLAIYLLLVIPSHGVRAMFVTGALMIGAVVTYVFNFPFASRYVKTRQIQE